MTLITTNAMHNYLGRVGALLALATILPLSSQAADKTVSEDHFCDLQFKQVKQSLAQNHVQMTIIVNDKSGVTPYTLVNANNEQRQYVIWEQLNGEVRGYALRDLQGFDYNTDRGYAGILSHHPSTIWDHVFSPKKNLSGYSCVVAGRTRVAGHKASILKLTPDEGLRFAYYIAKDDESSLPIELIVTNPKENTVVTKFTSLGSKLIEFNNFPAYDTQFDKFIPKAKKADAHGRKAIAWPEIKVPPYFKLQESSYFNSESLYQSYSDGIINFRVYKSKATSNFFPVANKGSILVLRKIFNNMEYAVVGEIPLELAEYVLSKL